MRFSPKSNEDIALIGLIKPGIYDFEVVESMDCTSKSGNEMIKLKLRIYEGNSIRIIYDYLLEQMIHKLKHFCDSVGLSEKYDQGLISSEDCIGKSGKVNIIIQHDKTGQYSDKNSVKDYVILKSYDMVQPKTNDNFLNDDIGF